MRKLILGATFAAFTAIACGMGNSADGGADGGPDLTGPFVGTWAGTTTFADGHTGSGTVVVVRTGTNTLGIGGICATGNVLAAVTSSTTLTLQTTNCAAGLASVGAGVCTVQYQVSGGTGALGTSQQLTLTVAGTVVNLDPSCTTLADTPLDFTLAATKQ